MKAPLQVVPAAQASGRSPAQVCTGTPRLRWGWEMATRRAELIEPARNLNFPALTGLLSVLRPGNLQRSSGSSNQHEGLASASTGPPAGKGPGWPDGSSGPRPVACQLSKKEKPCFIFFFFILCRCLWCKYCPHVSFPEDSMRNPLWSGEEMG